jgi:hypothetical protein
MRPVILTEVYRPMTILAAATTAHPTNRDIVAETLRSVDRVFRTSRGRPEYRSGSSGFTTIAAKQSGISKRVTRHKVESDVSKGFLLISKRCCLIWKYCRLVRSQSSAKTPIYGHPINSFVPSGPVALHKFTSERSAFVKLAPFKLAPEKSEPESSELLKSAPSKFALTNLLLIALE